MSSLPETLKEDFNQLDRLQGQFRVTSFLIEVVDVFDLSSRKGPPCGFCNVKEEMEMLKTLVEQQKPMITFSKVEVGSALYKEGIRWTETGQADTSMTSYMVLGHTKFNKNSQRNKILFSMNKLIIPDSNLFHIGFVDGRTLRQDTWYYGGGRGRRWQDKGCICKCGSWTRKAT